MNSASASKSNSTAGSGELDDYITAADSVLHEDPEINALMDQIKVKDFNPPAAEMYG